MASHDSNPGHQIELILQSVDSLPTLTPVATRVLSIGSSERADFAELTRLIEADPALTSKILGLCRRAALGLGDRITTVKRALVMLGFDAVRAAVLSVSVYDLISGEAAERDGQLVTDAGPGPARAFDRVGFWMYSVGVASAAELLAHGNRRLHVKPDEAFVAGLVHGLGKPILDLLLPRAYGRVVEIAEKRRSDMAPIEREILGIDHHAAARRIAERWGLPAALRDAVWLYDHPVASLPEGVAADVVRVVAVGRALCRELHVGTCGDHGPIDSAASVCEAAGLTRQSLDDATRRLHESVSERCKVLGLDEQAPPELLLRSITAANRSLARLSGDLQARATEGKRVAEVLGAIAEFWRLGGGSGDVVRTLGALARSAARVLGNGRWGAVFDGGGEHTWLLCLFDSEGSLARSTSGTPPGVLGGVSLRHASAWLERTGARSALCRWAGAELGLDPEISTLRVVVACEGESLPGCVLLTDAPDPEEPPDARHLMPLRATWSAALSAAVNRGASERLADSLADSNRALAAAQAKLTEAQAMARLGEMTAGAAHEMNNPLTVIRGRAQILAEALTDERDRKTAGTIARAAAELSDLVTALHELSRPGEAARTPVPVAEVLGHAIGLVEGATGRVRLEMPGDGPTPLRADVDGPRLAKALAELLRNARDWAPEAIVRARVQIDPADDRLVIRIEDDGPGLSPKAQRHAFDPFFSERPAGRGRGLGLSLAKRLVELHGGSLRLEPGEAGGTTAIVSLPDWRPATEREAGQAA
jgi:signal transduction histidine kinase/HD-like signal output (HDOD) protein